MRKKVRGIQQRGLRQARVRRMPSGEWPALRSNAQEQVLALKSVRGSLAADARWQSAILLVLQSVLQGVPNTSREMQ